MICVCEFVGVCEGSGGGVESWLKEIKLQMVPVYRDFRDRSASGGSGVGWQFRRVSCGRASFVGH